MCICIFFRLQSWADKIDKELLRLTVGEGDLTGASQLKEVPTKLHT